MRIFFQLFWMTLLIAVLFAYAMFEGGFTSWFLFDSFLPIFIYQICLLFYPLKGWNVSRTLTKKALNAGDSLQIHIKISRKIPFPLYYCIVEERLPSSLNRLDIRKKKYELMGKPEKLQTNRQLKKLIFPGFKKHIDISYELVDIPRGKHAFTAIRVQTGDIFGFVKKQHTFQVKNELMAYMSPQSVKLHEVINSYQQGGLVQNAVSMHNASIAAGIREYVPGDRFSWIDWKQTAKKNDVMTKEFEKEKSEDVLLVLNACCNQAPNWIQFDAIVELCAAMLVEFEKNATETTLLSMEEQAKIYPLRKGMQQMNHIWQYLAQLQPAKSFPVSLQQDLQKIPSGMKTFVLTMQLDDALDDTLRKMRMDSKSIHLLFVPTQSELTDIQQHFIRKWVKQEVSVNTITSKQLAAGEIEVKV